MKKIYLLALLSLLFSSCSPYLPIPREYLTKETMCLLQTRATNEILREHEKYAREKYGFYLYGEPKVRMRDKVYLIALSYHSRRKVELDEARRIHLDILNTLLEMFNNHPYYRDYMEDYPFKEENVVFQLGYYDENGMCYESPYLCVSSSKWKHDCIQYYRKEDKVPEEPFYEESPEEAEQKIKEASR
jgi:hypothetical protein